MLNFIKLSKGETWKASNRPEALPFLRLGEAWVTYSSCGKDYIVKAGERFPHCHGGEMVVEPLSAEILVELAPS